MVTGHKVKPQRLLKHMSKLKKPSPQKPSQAEIATRIEEAGRRAKAEAEARRAQQAPLVLPPERNGPKGPEPTRYGDWEKKGLISDF